MDGLNKFNLLKEKLKISSHIWLKNTVIITHEILLDVDLFFLCRL